MYPNQTLSHLKTVANYRTLMGDNHQHNQHIIEQADALEAAILENNQQLMLLFRELSRRLDKVEAEVEELKQTIKSPSQNNSSTPIAVDLVPTQASLRRMRTSIQKMLN